VRFLEIQDKTSRIQLSAGMGVVNKKLGRSFPKSILAQAREVCTYGLLEPKGSETGPLGRLKEHNAENRKNG
jgi:hypothetical protein